MFKQIPNWLIKKIGLVQVADCSFKIGQTVWIVQDYKIDRVKIEEVIVHYTLNETKINYGCINDIGKKMEVKGAFLVETLEHAKEVSLINWSTVSITTENYLETLTEKAFDDRKKAYEEKNKQK